MRNLILGIIISGLFLLTSCDKPVEPPKSSTNRYSFQVIESGGSPLIYVLDGKTGDVFVRTADGKWWDVSGIKSAEKGQ